MLNDTPERDYSRKLERFNRFAEAELRGMAASLGIQPTDRILDAGCGTGLITRWLAEAAPHGNTVGIDLAHAHIAHARATAPAHLPLTFEQADIRTFKSESMKFDWVFCSNTIHHLPDPVAVIRHLLSLLAPSGTLLLGRSAFLPDMFFAWDERLEEAVRHACYRYYRDKYGLAATDTSNMRNYFGWAKAAGGAEVTARTFVIERTAPLSDADEEYFLEVVFRGYWGTKIQPYLADADWEALVELTAPTSPHYSLRRPDFHHIQSYSLIAARRVG